MARSGSSSKSPAKPFAARAVEVNMYGKALQFAELARPHVLACARAVLAARQRVAPYASDDDLARLAAGFIITFFGARYAATIAAFEAYRLVAWDSTATAVFKLYDNYAKVAQASAKDDALDADADGVPDVAQIPLQQLIARKLPIVLKSIDPAGVNEALAALYGGLAAVLATLRVGFAATFTIGAALGEVAEHAVRAQATELAARTLAAEHAKFVPLLVHHGLRLAGISAAFVLQRLAHAAHSALRGSQLLAEGALGVCVRRGYVSAARASDSQLKGGLQLALAALGLLSQWRNGFGVPFPLSALLFPLSAVEAIVTTVAGVA